MSIAVTDEAIDIQEKQDQAWLTMRVGEQWFALPVLEVQGVLRQWEMTKIPLAPPEVEGVMNGTIKSRHELRKLHYREN